MESKAIVIGTDYGREDWLANCLKTLEGCKYQVIVLTQGRYELGKIKWVYDHTDLEEFIFLHDTMEIKRFEWMDEAFAHPFSVSLTPMPNMYLAKYQRKVLKHVPIPEAKTKEDSVYYEGHFAHEYFKVDPAFKVLWDNLEDAADGQRRYIEAFGRLNLILENDDIAKYKGTWSLEQALEIDRRGGLIKI